MYSNMLKAKKKFYITTSLPYTNAFPHIGFALELVQADVLARYHRGLGQDVFFLTGTDEHGAKIAKAAAESGKNPKEFTDEISTKYKELSRAVNASNDDFIRTTDQNRHWPIVKKVWLKLKGNNDIYKKQYKGLYCSGCEAFITKKDLKDGKCLIHQKEPEAIEEENYFFRLSKYAKEIKRVIEGDRVKIIPEVRKNEMLSFIKQGLEDISFSRPRKDLQWGIPVPDDDTQTIYVWADALTNYISALGYDKEQKYKKYWPADIQCLGKDILKFHAIFWLGMLMSLKLPLPKRIFVHGFITVSGQKMSKSLGNIVDPFLLVKKYGVDALRYFLLRELPPTEDGDFTFDKFEKRYNADLAKGLGNLLARVVVLRRKLKIPASAEATAGKKNKNGKITDKNFKQLIAKTRKECRENLDKFRFNESLGAVWNLIGFCDKYIEKERPWEAGKNQKEVIGNLLFAIGQIAELIKPFLPETSEKISDQLKTEQNRQLFPGV